MRKVIAVGHNCIPINTAWRVTFLVNSGTSEDACWLTWGELVPLLHSSTVTSLSSETYPAVPVGLSRVDAGGDWSGLGQDRSDSQPWYAIRRRSQ